MSIFRHSNDNLQFIANCVYWIRFGISATKSSNCMRISDFRHDTIKSDRFLISFSHLLFPLFLRRLHQKRWAAGFSLRTRHCFEVQSKRSECKWKPNINKLNLWISESLFFLSTFNIPRPFPLGPLPHAAVSPLCVLCSHTLICSDMRVHQRKWWKIASNSFASS